MSPRKTDIFFVTSPDVQHFCPSVHLPHKVYGAQTGRIFASSPDIPCRGNPSFSVKPYGQKPNRRQTESNIKLCSSESRSQATPSREQYQTCLNIAEARRRKAKPIYSDFSERKKLRCNTHVIHDRPFLFSFILCRLLGWLPLPILRYVLHGSLSLKQFVLKHASLDHIFGMFPSTPIYAI